MDSGRQIIRWSIPGGLLLIGVAGAFLTLRLAEGASLAEATGPIRTNLPAATGIALSVPLGFLVYQLYYLSQTPRRWFQVVVGNRGEAVLNHLSTDQRRALAQAVSPLLGTASDSLTDDQRQRLSALQWRTEDQGIVTGRRLIQDPWSSPPTIDRATSLTRVVGGRHLLAPVRDLDGPCTPEEQEGNGEDRKWRNAADRDLVAVFYEERCKSHHLIASVLVDGTAFASAGDLKRDYTAFSDIYHAQGAARLGIVAGVIIGVAANSVQLLINERARGGLYLTACVLVAMGYALAGAMYLLSAARERSYRETSARLGYGLRLLYADQDHLFDLLMDRSVATAVVPQTP